MFYPKLCVLMQSLEEEFEDTKGR